MGRGLSDLQRTILEMAYERFEKHVKEYDEGKIPGRLTGVHYNVLIGPSIPNPEHVEEFWENQICEENRRMVLAHLEPRMEYGEIQDAVDKKRDGYIGKLRQRKSAQEERARALPTDVEGVDSFGENIHRSRWETVYSELVGFDGGREKRIDHEALRAARFLNNAPEARRIVNELRGCGAWYMWLGVDNVYTGEILERVYGFKPKYKHDTDPGWPYRDGIKFDPQEIGEKRYNAARASVSRALTRLRDRVLIERGGHGTAMITLEGVAEHIGVTVNEVCHKYKLNRSDNNHTIIDNGREDEQATPEELAERTAVMRRLQGIFSPPPPSLADQLYEVIASHIVRADGATKGEIEEAFTEAMQRIDNMQEEATVNEL